MYLFLKRSANLVRIKCNREKVTRDVDVLRLKKKNSPLKEYFESKKNLQDNIQNLKKVNTNSNIFSKKKKTIKSSLLVLFNKIPIIFY